MGDKTFLTYETARLRNVVENGIREESSLIQPSDSSSSLATESIIDDQLARLQKMYKEGKLSKEDYETQTQKWKERRNRYNSNVEEANKRKEEEERIENNKPINRIRNMMKSKYGDTKKETRIVGRDASPSNA